MAMRLTQDVALALLCNTIATAAMLFVLIVIFAPVSGAHFNPAVTMVAFLRRAIPARTALLYVLAQLIGAIAGVWLAHAMFGEALFAWGVKERSGFGQSLSEAVATFGLVLTIAGCIGAKPRNRGRRGRALYRQRLLVHRFHLLCQSSGHHRACFDAKLRRNSSRRCARFHRRTIGGRFAGRNGLAFSLSHIHRSAATESPAAA